MSNDEAKEMRSSWLVQRLQRPLPSNHILGKDNPFAFGGGIRNGGLSSEAMDLLRGIFAFDYMGASEFEWGAVPKALNAVASDADRLVHARVEIPLSKVEKSWRKDDVHPTGTATVYVLCDKDHLDEVVGRIRGWAKGGKAAPHLKEATHLPEVLRGAEYHDRTCGWLELDNGFMFFTDRPMFEATASLFGVELPSEATV